MSVAELEEKMNLDDYKKWFEYYLRNRMKPDSVVGTLGIISRNMAQFMGDKNRPFEDYMYPYYEPPISKNKPDALADKMETILKGFM